MDITKPKRIEDAMIDKVDCFCIKGKYAESPMTLWIDKVKFLVRKIDIQHEFDNFRTEETTIYTPVINTEITDKMLEFAPPKQK